MNNKYEEALNWFQKQICAEKSDFCKSIKCYPAECDECSETKYYKTLQELIDKETPKMVNKEIEEYPTYYKVDYECPTCKENLNFEEYAKRCPDCGQKLDWSKK